jgi:hypothetical protein
LPRINQMSTSESISTRVPPAVTLVALAMVQKRGARKALT